MFNYKITMLPLAKEKKVRRLTLKKLRSLYKEKFPITINNNIISRLSEEHCFVAVPNNSLC